MDIPEEDLKIYEENYEKVKNNYNIKRPYHWAWKIFKDQLKGQNPNLRIICEYLGPEFEKDYVQAYGTDSLLVHGSPILHDYYADRKKNVTVNAPKFTDLINSLGALTIVYCAKAITLILKYLNIRDFSDIDVFMNYYCHEVLFHKYK